MERLPIRIYSTDDIYIINDIHSDLKLYIGYIQHIKKYKLISYDPLMEHPYANKHTAMLIKMPLCDTLEGILAYLHMFGINDVLIKPGYNL